MGLETTGYIPPDYKHFKTPETSKKSLTKNSMEKKVTREEMSDILMERPKIGTDELYKILTEDLDREKEEELRKKAKKEEMVDQIILNMKEYLNSPEHAKKTQENLFKAIREAIKTIEEQGEEIIKLKIAGHNTGAKKAQPIPREFKGKILEGTDDEEETKIGINPLLEENYNETGKEANS